MSVDTIALSSGGGARVRRAGDGAPLVVLLPAIMGINPYIEGIQDDLAAKGYTVAAIDYWTREGTVPTITNSEEAMAAVAKVRDPDVVADVAAVTDAIDAPTVAVLGFCIGGTQAILAGAKVPAVASAVAFYGLLRYPQTNDAKPEIPLDVAADGLNIPFLGHWGDSDHLVPASDVTDLRAALAGRPAEVYLYPGAGHAFHETARPEAHRPVAAHDAWTRTIAFLEWTTR